MIVTQVMFSHKLIQNLAMYHQHNFQVCISKIMDASRALYQSLTKHLNLRGDQTNKRTNRQTDKQILYQPCLKSQS